MEKFPYPIVPVRNKFRRLSTYLGLKNMKSNHLHLSITPKKFPFIDIFWFSLCLPKVYVHVLGMSRTKKKERLLKNPIAQTSTITQTFYIANAEEKHNLDSVSYIYIYAMCILQCIHCGSLMKLLTKSLTYKFKLAQFTEN